MMSKLSKLVLPALFLLTIGLFGAKIIKEARAAPLGGGTITLSDSRPSTAGVGYTASFDNVTTTSTVKCVKLVFGTAVGNTAPPTGIGTTGVAVAASSNFVTGISGWTLDDNTNGVVKIYDATGGTPSSSTDRLVNLDGVYNGSTADTSYVLLLYSYGNQDCESSLVDSGTASFIWTTGQSVSMTVDPSLSFALSSVAVGQSVNGAAVSAATTTSTIPLGTVTSSANAVAAHTLTVSTNASGGYTVYTHFSQTLTNGSSDTITDHTGTNDSPTSFPVAGNEAFGYTTEDTSLNVTGDGADRFGANEYAGFATSNEEVAYSGGPVSNEATKVGYQVGIAGNTEAGTYTTTVIYTATPTY
ncbi:MAG TPA: hypothetical protein VMW25_05605 [Clostridia bacterium]|nr:hypothetical protein [Clostridia bacterium]